MKIISKKGTTLVEAAMIFPLVIASVIAVLVIVIGMYQSLTIQTSIHLDLRNESGELSRTIYRQMEHKKYHSVKDRVGIRPVIRMEIERRYQIEILFKDSVIRKEKGRYFVINEADLIRVLTMFEEPMK